jgi:hypothetical protein
MKREQIIEIMKMASRNGDILHYQRMREKLIKLTGSDETEAVK